jgi:hypothetical protein
MDGRADAAFQWLDELAQLAGPRPDVAELGGELRSAYGGIYQLAQKQTGADAQVAIVQRARTLFSKRGQRLLAAACLHDAGSFYGDAGQLPQMRAALQAAAAERQQLGDLAGLGWTCNNRANYELQAGKLDEAAAALHRGYELCARGEALLCQQALAINLGGLLAAARAEEPSGALVDALWQLAGVLCRSKVPFVFPPDRAIRETLAADVRRGGKGAAAAANRAVTLLGALFAAAQWPIEVKADLQLRIAAVLADGDAQAQQQARRLLEGVDAGRGPCAAHLAARRDARLAVLAARRGDVAAYDAVARKATDAMSGLGDRATLLQLLADVTGALAAGKSQVRDALGKQLDELKRSGGPGGDGASASSQAVGTLPADANEHTPCFELSWHRADDGSDVAVLHDLIGGSERPLSCRWKPHNCAFNGCGIGMFGGYFVVRAMAYGGAAASAGAPGQSTLDDLGSYLPLSADGVWQILQNGAVRFVPRK